MKNNNQKILRLLAKREYQENKRRNRILIGTVAFAVWMIFCVFSLAIGKIQADYLLMVRNGGTKASTTLEDPSEEQYRKIQELAYIRSAGMETDFAATDAFLCTVLDKTAWENMQKPALYGICRSFDGKSVRLFFKDLSGSAGSFGSIENAADRTEQERGRSDGGRPVVSVYSDAR